MRSTAKQLNLLLEEPDPLSGFSVRESGRAKRLSIKVFPRGRVEVVVPKRTRPGEVRNFVAANRNWIRKAREEFAAEHAPEPFALPQCVQLQGIGRRFEIFYRPENGATAVAFRGGRNRVTLSGKTGDEQLCVAALKRWLSSLARKEYLPQLRSLSVLVGQSFNRLNVRGQRTCWGSHSSTGTISLNYCLLFLDPEQLRYVMVHELCHGRHMNHSRRFWDLVGRFEPNYRQLDKELNSCWKRIPTWVGIY